MRWAHRFIEQNPSLRDSHIVRSVAEELDRVRPVTLYEQRDPIAIATCARRGQLMPSRRSLTKDSANVESPSKTELPEVRLPSIELPGQPMPSVDWSSPELRPVELGIALFVIIAVATFYI